MLCALLILKILFLRNKFCEMKTEKHLCNQAIFPGLSLILVLNFLIVVKEEKFHLQMIEIAPI